jgi:CBS domain-containing protein
MQATKAAADARIELSEPVRSLLHQKGQTVWTIPPDATVYEAIKQMADKKIGALIVMRAGRLDGIVTERDYARNVILKGKQSRETRVHDIMTAQVLFVTPNQSIDDCMRLMTSRRVRHLPVLEGESVVGIVSMGDLVNWIIASHEQTIQHLQNYIAGTYPG